jgi:hypothetical protein
VCATLVTQHPFNYYTSRGKLTYPKGVDRFTFVGAWMNHYYSKSLSDYVAKNARGSPNRYKGPRNTTGLPEGIDEVFNLHIVADVRQRLQGLRDSGQVERADKLDALLLGGAPRPTAVAESARATAIGASKRWSRAFVDDGVAVLERSAAAAAEARHARHKKTKKKKKKKAKGVATPTSTPAVVGDAGVEEQLPAVGGGTVAVDVGVQE